MAPERTRPATRPRPVDRAAGGTTYWPIVPTSTHTPADPVRLTHPEWSKDAVIYQINQRHFTPEGTFAAAAEHLPRLRDLGVDILWLMPINPIGEQNRKGGLGSPYAVRVANHTAWDNVLVDEHPEWYRTDFKGDFVPTPWWDWDDVIDLDYDQPGLREYMADAMAHWVREADVDGFRCDVAGYVPVDFWESARAQLEQIKPVFLLAEWENRDLHVGAFDATYAWSWNETMHHIAHGRASATDLKVYYAWNERAYPRDIMRMLFVSNHDKNAWEGTEHEQFGPMLEAAVVMSVVSEGIPMIYSGQEAGNDRRLTFFDKDEIVWREDPQGELYRRLFALKKQHPALWNAAWGARMVRVPNDGEDRVISFVRVSESGDAVIAAFNLSGAPASVTLGVAPGQDLAYVDATDGSTVEYAEGSVWQLPAWGYRVGVTPQE